MSCYILTVIHSTVKLYYQHTVPASIALTGDIKSQHNGNLLYSTIMTIGHGTRLVKVSAGTEVVENAATLSAIG